jgi:hypothetical protein
VRVLSGVGSSAIWRAINHPESSHVVVLILVLGIAGIVYDLFYERAVHGFHVAGATDTANLLEISTESS